MINMESRISDLYHNPIGHDAVYKILMQLKINEKLITNPFVSHMKIKTIAKLTHKQLGNDFFEALFTLVNSEDDRPFVS